MIGGGRRSKYASSYDGKSPEEIRKVKKARKAALETHPQNDNDCVKFSHMALEDVKMTWAVFLYYMKSISYNELQWKKRRVGMIPGYKKYERSLQKRKFNGC